MAGKTKVWIYVPKQNERLGSGETARETEQGGSDQDIRKSKIQQKIDELYRKLAYEKDPLEREKLSEQIIMLTMAMNALMFGMKMPEFLIGMLLNTVV